ncbi:MAG: phosphatase PAP2 family protein [Pseudomonadales bacterium]|jgi:acid phosphatase (class A)|nr:phosphatase PAP2 family protein [Pseudomonadales bacterium]
MNSQISKKSLKISTHSLLIALALGWAGLPALAAEQSFLVAEKLDPQRLLPPPPTDPLELAEDLAVVKRVIAARTPQRLAAAQWDDDHEDASLYGATLGPGFDLAALPATAELLTIVKREASQAGKTAKAVFARNRPWAVDPAIVSICDPNDKPATSYPSGHGMLGYATALVLVELLPNRAQAILARAQDYGFSRVVCGSHFPSDLRASAMLSTYLVDHLLQDAEFQVKLEAARVELQAAKLTL